MARRPLILWSHGGHVDDGRGAMLATVANLAIVVAMCMTVMVGAISTEAPEASPAMADTIAEEEYMAGVAEDERPQLCTPNLEFLHPPLHPDVLMRLSTCFFMLQILVFCVQRVHSQCYERAYDEIFPLDIRSGRL